MTLIDGYTQTLLLPQLRSLALSNRQQAIVVEDVSRRLKSLLFHWNDLEFRRTILILGTEEASFWEPQTAKLEIRSLVVVAVRNSLIEDLGASHPYTKMLESRKKQLRDEQMPSITSEATKYFEAADLDGAPVQPKKDLFGDLPRRFPNAWHALALLNDFRDPEGRGSRRAAGVSPRSGVLCQNRATPFSSCASLVLVPVLVLKSSEKDRRRAEACPEDRQSCEDRILSPGLLP